jgi:hypothetical protein
MGPTCVQTFRQNNSLAVSLTRFTNHGFRALKVSFIFSALNQHLTHPKLKFWKQNRHQIFFSAYVRI